MTQQQAIRPLLVASLGVAAASFAVPWLSHANNPAQITASCWLAVLWVILVGTGIVKHGARGLWLLVGAPLALFWAGLVLEIGWNCAHNIRMCP